MYIPPSEMESCVCIDMHRSMPIHDCSTQTLNHEYLKYENSWSRLWIFNALKHILHLFPAFFVWWGRVVVWTWQRQYSTWGIDNSVMFLCLFSMYRFSSKGSGCTCVSCLLSFYTRKRPGADPSPIHTRAAVVWVQGSITWLCVHQGESLAVAGVRDRHGNRRAVHLQ